jgi:site-specific recombinase XerD
VDAVLAAPNRETKQGQRDHALLLFLYNTGARASEVADLAVDDLDLRHSRSVRIVGKGNKIRHCPLWDLTISALQPLVGNRITSEKLFLNRCKRSITRFGIHTLVERYVEQAINIAPSLSRKRVSPHTFRHTTAVHLLRAGVDINTIRAWLGHVSVETTNIYAEVDLEMKSKALALCEMGDGSYGQKKPKESLGVMGFLKDL